MIGFNVSQLLKLPTGASRHVEVDELGDSIAADLRLVSPTRGSLRRMRTADGILGTGTLSQRVEPTGPRRRGPFARTQHIQNDHRPVED